MNFSLFIAKRYFFSKKNTNVINIITAISIVGVMLGSLALIVILSVFNGLEDLVISRFNSFDPEIKITNVDEKNFIPNEKIKALKQDKDIKFASYTLTENTLIKYKDKHHPFKVKGVDLDFVNVTGVDTMMIRGMFKLNEGEMPTAVMGYTVEYMLSANIYMTSSLKLYLPRQKGKVSNLNPEAAFHTSSIAVVGVYGVDKEVDDYVLVPLSYLQRVGKFDNKIDAIDIKLIDANKTIEVKKRLEKLLGKDFLVQDRFQQHATIYKIMRSEKAMVFLILSFILLIASFNIIGSITMLILDKKRDVEILQSIGGRMKSIKNIFITEGIIISQAGLILGLVLGAIIIFLQEKYGFMKLAGSADSIFIVDAYPVKLIFKDIFYVYVTVSLIGVAATIIPVKYAFKKLVKSLYEKN